MAKILIGQIISDIRGSIGGVTYSRNSAGIFACARVKGVNPRTPKQTQNRALFANVSRGWRSLSNADRSSWIAAAPFYPHLDAFHNNSPLTGQQYYNAANRILGSINVSTIPNAPVLGTITQQNFTNLVTTVGGSVINLTLDIVVPAGQHLLIQMSPGVSQGRNYMSTRFRQTHVFNAGTGAAYNLFSTWNATFGQTAKIGMRIFVRWSCVSDSGANRSAWVYATSIFS